MGHQSHLLPRAWGSPPAQKPAGTPPLGEQASQSQGDRALALRKLLCSFCPLTAHPVHRPLCVHIHSGQYRNCCQRFVSPNVVSSERAGAGHRPDEGLSGGWGRSSRLITPQRAWHHRWKPHWKGSGARPPPRPVSWASGPDETTAEPASS